MSDMTCPNCGGELSWKTNKPGYRYCRCDDCNETYGADEVDDSD